MKSKITLPKGLLDKFCKWYDPAKLGGMPPARFLPNLRYTKETEEFHRNRVKITILESIQKYFPVFKTGGAEDAINLARTHEFIITYEKLEEQYNKLQRIHLKEKVALKELKK